MVDGYQLGAWVVTQRVRHADEGTLDADRERRLQELPGWIWDARVDNWEEGFSRLQDYVERHGDARVPQPYTVDGYPLGVWVGAQRQFHRKGTLEADRERRLQGLTGWTWDARADKWEQGFSRLQDYIERHRHASVPVAYTVDGYRLGQWVITQRHFHANGTLDADREHRLHDLPGWKWDPFADQWEEGFRWLVEYVERHGDARVPHFLHGRRLQARLLGLGPAPEIRQRHP